MGIKASHIASFLNAELHGKDISLIKVSSLDSMYSNSVVYAKQLSEDIVHLLNNRNDLLAIVCREYDGLLRNPHIISLNPRLDFARILKNFFEKDRKVGIESTAIVSKTASIGMGSYIGHYSIIGDGVVIGNCTEIRDHVVIKDNCAIGNQCIIKSNTVIGEEGFGFEFDENGAPIRIPHLGSVRIGDEVEVGALNVIARGTLDDTILSDKVKTDDHVFIAHNVKVGENTVIIAGTEISGSVTIGKNVWIAPQSTIINKVDIGDNSFIGIGSVVIKSVDSDVVVAGFPARKIKDRDVTSDKG
ncbi:hypothetical protein [Cohnella cellulosilytica]|uniref:UDP-3-O-[3-hydroxymyristoyl] glucosamine N-acyltransferase n=1 Tax=Cohnella cellulosilytica TaxID=986710 RepID=A0ABW2FE68_9BACL